MGDCDLCGLALPDQPFRGADTGGVYCCPGCRQVASLVGNIDDEPTIANGKSDGSTEIPDDAAVAYLRVEGMRCATCESFLERQGPKTEGIFTLEAS